VAFIILKRTADFLPGNADCEFHPKKKHNQLRIILGFVANVPQFLCFIDQYLGNTDCQYSFITLAKCSSSLSQFFCVKQGSKVMKGATWHCLP
jgi:hypothetical protein